MIRVVSRHDVHDNQFTHCSSLSVSNIRFLVSYLEIVRAPQILAAYRGGQAARLEPLPDEISLGGVVSQGTPSSSFSASMSAEQEVGCKFTI